MTTIIDIIGLHKKFTSLHNKITTALSNVSFNIPGGEFVSIIGPSGSGKSTILNLISGIIKPTWGKINFIGDKKIKIGYVFQNDSVFPWYTVKKNLAFSLGLSKNNIKNEIIIEKICSQIGLEPEIFLNKYPKELSGGEKRRVAIGMAIAYEPELFLLDEPTTQLDYLTKWKIQNLIQELWMLNKFSVLQVTHDLEEAIYLSDKVLVLDKGEIKEMIEIKLTRPRSDEIRSSKLFLEYKKNITDLY